MRPVVLAATLSALLVVPLGCGHRSAPRTPKATPRSVVVAKDGTPLPEWAPENPSPEFLRAARFMQPIRETPGPEAGLGSRAVSAHFSRTQIAAWEVLGSLTDEQLAHLVSAKEALLPVKSLTEKQRALLERYFAVWRREMKGMPGWPEDVLVELYKGGAREDLSNVVLGFRVRRSDRVAAILYVSKPDGRLAVAHPWGLGDFVQRKGGK